MKTRPAAIAAEDLTGPWVLKVQRSARSLGRTTGETPSNAGPPRNMGQVVRVGERSLDAAMAGRVRTSSNVETRNAIVPRAIGARRLRRFNARKTWKPSRVASAL